MSSPTILFCSQAAHVGGGTEIWLGEMDRALTDRGWRVVVALASGRFHDPHRYLAHHHHASTLTLDGRSGLREERILSLLAAFDRVAPDVIVPVNLSDAMHAATLWKQNRPAVRLVTCIHAHDERQLSDLGACSPWIDLAVSVSRAVADRLAATMGEELVSHIPTGVPEASSVRTRTEIREVGYVGRLDPGDKRALDLIPLARRLSSEGIRLRIAGAGPAEKAIRSGLATEIASGAVIMHGLLTREELYRDIYPRLDALVVFSERETGPIAAWEAMLHGAVPVVSDFTGRKEEGILSDGRNALVFPVGAVETAARLILENGSVVRALSEEAQRLPDAYRFLGFQERWDRELRQCLEREPRSGPARADQDLASPGILSRAGLRLRHVARIRRLLGRTYQHDESGSEWPH